MRRVALGFLIAGAALLLLGIVAAVDWYTGPDRRVREGVPVPALVEQVGTWGGARTGGAWVRVAYQIDGVTHRVGLGTTSDDAGVAKGDIITVYVDRDDPERVVTGTGLVSDYRRGLLPPVLVAAGIVVMGIAAPRLRRRAPAAAVPGAPVGAGAGRPEPPVEFGYAMPGYRADLVDLLLVRVHRALGEAGGSGPAAALAALRQADLPTAPRGYRRDQVDLYIRQLLAELEG
nr:hypothetical protein GCM10020063_069410 [Dactylosporangium thailandense]